MKLIIINQIYRDFVYLLDNTSFEEMQVIGRLDFVTEKNFVMMLCRTTKDVRISCRTQQRPHSSIAVAARASAVLRGSLISFTSVCLRVSLFLLCVCITARDIAIVFFFLGVWPFARVEGR
jgi:hypothetical protein